MDRPENIIGESLILLSEIDSSLAYNDFNQPIVINDIGTVMDVIDNPETFTTDQNNL